MDGVLVVAAFTAGFMGQAHCAAMCGPLVALLERRNRTDRLPAGRRRGLYQLGRLTSYAVLGALAGLVGLGTTSALPVGVATLVVRVAAAVAVLVVGMSLLGYRGPLECLQPVAQRTWRWLVPLTRHVLPMSTAPRAFAAGMLWGLLPCGLVLGAVLLALAAGSLGAGIAAMAAFWAGTLPVTLAIGGGAGLNRADPRLRQWLGGALVGVAAFSVGMQLATLGAAAAAPDWQQAMALLCQH